MSIRIECPCLSESVVSMRLNVQPARSPQTKPYRWATVHSHIFSNEIKHIQRPTTVLCAVLHIIIYWECNLNKIKSFWFRIRSAMQFQFETRQMALKDRKAATAIRNSMWLTYYVFFLFEWISMLLLNQTCARRSLLLRVWADHFGWFREYRLASHKQIRQCGLVLVTNVAWHAVTLTTADDKLKAAVSNFGQVNLFGRPRHVGFVTNVWFYRLRFQRVWKVCVAYQFIKASDAGIMTCMGYFYILDLRKYGRVSERWWPNFATFL